MWDFKTRKLIREIDWESGKKYENAYIYAIQFSKADNNTILSGCCGLNQVRLFGNKI